MRRGGPRLVLRRRKWLTAAGYYVAALVATVFAVFPITWGILTSIKTKDTVFRAPPQWLPDPITFDNYQAVIFGSNMPIYFRNSVIVVLATVLFSVVIAAMGAYSLNRFRLRGKTIIMFFVLMTSMVPTVALIVPLYSITTQLQMHDNLGTLILVFTAFQIPLTLWLLRGYFQNVPAELDDAAMIDGCSRLQVFTRVILPLSRPALAAAAVPVWVYVWNDFIIPIALTATDSNRVVSIGLYYYITVFGIEWGHLMAAVTLVLVPALIAFAFLQKNFIAGLTAGAVKE
ncbi:MAG: carbohydrate ABC transporter permease [Chloroflexota bacterium]